MVSVLVSCSFTCYTMLVILILLRLATYILNSHCRAYTCMYYIIYIYLAIVTCMLNGMEIKYLTKKQKTHSAVQTSYHKNYINIHFSKQNLNYCNLNYRYRLSNNTHTHAHTLTHARTHARTHTHTHTHTMTCAHQSPLVHSYNN